MTSLLYIDIALITNKLIYSFHHAVKFVFCFIGSNIVQNFFNPIESQIIY